MMQSNSFGNCVHYYNIETLNLFFPEMQLINTKPMIKDKLNKLLRELEKFRVQKILVLDYKKRNNRKIFHSTAKLIASDSGIDDVFIYMHQNVVTKT